MSIDQYLLLQYVTILSATLSCIFMLIAWWVSRQFRKACRSLTTELRVLSDISTKSSEALERSLKACSTAATIQAEITRFESARIETVRKLKAFISELDSIRQKGVCPLQAARRETEEFNHHIEGPKPSSPNVDPW